MIDTIRLRLHSLFDTIPKKTANGINHPTEVEHLCKGHYELYKKLMIYDGKYFETMTFVDKIIDTTENIDVDDYLHLEYSKKLQGHFLNKQIMRFQSEKKITERNMRTMGKMRISSSENDMIFSINHEKGLIDFEFSIPKHLYQHNLAQFVPQIKSKHFSQNPTNHLTAKSWEHQIKILHSRFIKFVKHFINELQTFFDLTVPIDLNYLELLRVDFCFNQYFETKKDALKYLSLQKNINNKYNRTSYQSNKPYDTSIAFKSQSKSFFKIYHKGTEYSTVGDMKKHIKINFEYYEKLLKQKVKTTVFTDYKKNHEYLLQKVFEKDTTKDKVYVSPIVDKEKLLKHHSTFKKHQIFDVKFLLDEMDKVLRYEITMRPKYMAYHFKTKFFRKNCPYFFQYKKVHDKVRSINDSRNSNKRKRIVGKYENDIYQHYKKWLQRSMSFMFTDSHLVKMFNKHSVGKGVQDYDPVSMEYNISNVDTYKYCYTLSQMDIAPIENEFFTFLVNQFYEMFKHFQIKELEIKDDFVQLLKNYNDQANKNIESYNKLNAFKIIGYDGKPIIRNGKKVKKATQLLTQKQLTEKHLKKVNIPVLTVLHQKLEQGFSLHQIRQDMMLSSSSYSRYKKDLELFGVSEQSQVIKQKIKPCNDFSYYYNNQKSLIYNESFFPNLKYLLYA